jgi:hypothetical protein
MKAGAKALDRARRASVRALVKQALDLLHEPTVPSGCYGGDPPTVGQEDRAADLLRTAAALLSVSKGIDR